MRAIPLTIAALIVFVAGGASLRAQQKPDFTGRWVIVSPPEGKGQEQVVTLVGTSLTKARPDGTRKTAYQLDGVERRMPLPSGGTRMAGDITITAAAKWDGDRIVITTITNYSGGMRTEGKDVWSIDAQGRLVIDYTETGPGAPPKPTKVIFTRKGKA
jgi:hypothetical protein